METTSSSPLGWLLFAWVCLSPFLVTGLAIGLFLIWRKSRTTTAAANASAAEANRMAALKDTNYRSAAREEWLSRVGALTFANEVEVEVKFVYPLLLHLGYTDADFSVRYRTNMQAGRELLQKEADWVIWKRGTNNEKAALVVEAKAPSQPLDSLVQGQARSYAFAVNAPLYVLTNGRDFEVYERGIESDTCRFKAPAGALNPQWTELERLIGASRAA